ncbi:methyltransferase domain-containing protein [Isosphaeraceae bacterium EP7]
MDEAEFIASQMALYAACPDVQVIQTRMRLQLVRGWRIPEGARVLEVGCGQGDMTAVLAHVVGSSGRVTAIDNADPDYGGPVTVGRSAEHLSESALGPRIAFHYGYDLLDEANGFPPDSFDYVVFAHCSWYFGSLDQLRRSLARVRPWASTLCFAEWDLEPRSIDQVAHMLAVLIQGQVEAYQTDSDANVRSPFSGSTLRGLLGETDWSIASDESIDTGPLHDGRWEIDRCLETSTDEAEGLDLPQKLVDLIGSQTEILGLLAEKHGSRSLPSYSIVASKSLA